MSRNWIRRALGPLVQFREGELATGLLMFAYSFLAMTAYNVIKPITRSKFISSLGADNLPYVQLAAGLLIGVIMQGYSVLVSRLPRRYVAPLTLAGMSFLLVGFWFLFRNAGDWVSVGFYLLGLILGILLISQFWTLANDIYDARQAKRVFGFIGGGSSLGGMTGAGLTALIVSRIGTENLLLCSAGILFLCAVLVALIVRREAAAGKGGAAVAEEEGVGGKEAIRLLRESRHLQIIALVIAFAAVGAGLIEQQLNMAAEAFKGREATDNLTAFLAQVTLYLSAIGFFIQVALTSRIHRYLGVGFALLVLPTSLGVTGVVMLLNAALWAPAMARILDTSLRYTLDKTTREVLFLPLPTALKYRAKPFVDVTVDRFAKGLAALLALVLIKPWGLGFSWQQISYASLTVMALWVFTAVRARREYLATFRRSIERREVEAAAVRPDLADPATVEALVEELGHPDEERVLYAIDLLGALNRRRLVTPLLLHHQSDKVRVRALQALEEARPELRDRWAGAVASLLKDASAEVRAAAVHALGAIRGEAAAEVMRQYLDDADPRVATTAAASLAATSREADVALAEAVFDRLAADTRETAVESRRQVALALGVIPEPRFRSRLVPLMFDEDPAVAREAIRSAGRGGGPEDLLVPPLVSLLRRRAVHDAARDVLVGRGEGALRRPRPLPGRRGGGRRGAAPHPGHSRPHSLGEVGRAADREPEDGGRDPARPRSRRALGPPAGATRHRHRAGAGRGGGGGRGEAGPALREPALQSRARRRPGLAPRPGARGAVRTVRGPRVSPPRSSLSLAGRGGGAPGDGTRRSRPGPGRRVPRQHALGSAPPVADAAPRGGAPRGEGREGECSPPHPRARRRGHARPARPRRRGGARRRRDPARRGEGPVGARRRPRARARAP